MVRRIHLVRHAQGFHNLSRDNEHMHDPLLTPHGITQCETFAASFPYNLTVDMVVASPLRRTIYTALISSSQILQSRPDMKIVLLPELQEAGSSQCDIGSPRTDLENEFTGKFVDFELLRDQWQVKKGYAFPSYSATSVRAQTARQWLRAQNAEEILVVSHGSFLHFLTDDWEGLKGGTSFKATGWANVEFRTYEFDSKKESVAGLTETAESRERRKGSEIPLTEDEQRGLRDTAIMEWESIGYVKRADDGEIADEKVET